MFTRAKVHDNIWIYKIIKMLIIEKIHNSLVIIIRVAVNVLYKLIKRSKQKLINNSLQELKFTRRFL